ncbi:uncharacterized protein LOC112141215 isoform X2 [Oryzias melastigma]|uniref:uncharacterized protein LOC112141215 isoform X2 n=1 Tax=Oryzias melastigma TaxID=30732 RepID=UPI000CF82C45|nr:uncharacterized protein LOC112141215 isoform X2 [Oryzias melastigma]
MDKTLDNSVPGPPSWEVIRLKRKRVQNPETERVCMADPLKFCIFQTSKTQDKDSSTQMSNLFSGCSAKPAADGFTRTALETGDYSKVFCCGCTDLPDSTGFGKSVEEEDILSLFPADMIKALHEDLTTGKLRSNRMYLWQNPMSSLTLKQDLKIFQLLRTIEEATGVGSLIRKGEIQLLDYVFDVMLPEILINKGKTRLQAEILLAKGGIFKIMLHLFCCSVFKS